MSLVLCIAFLQLIFGLSTSFFTYLCLFMSQLHAHVKIFGSYIVNSEKQCDFVNRVRIPNIMPTQIDQVIFVCKTLFSLDFSFWGGGGIVDALRFPPCQETQIMPSRSKLKRLSKTGYIRVRQPSLMLGVFALPFGLPQLCSWMFGYLGQVKEHHHVLLFILISVQPIRSKRRNGTYFLIGQP